ncbi:unnamed protein product [Polarella glacialis]|uniref:Photosystem II Psb31 protein domain-containing protein n=1 Tax=Polarella glacialis TaxID=89957 RepID=A0A813FYH6_POLGL|nr:unnamed protein product [Polarella glacialis]
MARGRALSSVVLLVAASVAVRTGLPAFLTPGSEFSRRDALAVASGAAVATLGVQTAWADAQGEPNFALFKYGPPILKLKDAVEKGDMDEVLRKENKFKLLNGYWRNQPEQYKEVNMLTEQILDAAAGGNTKEVKDLYAQYVSRPDIKIITTYPKPNVFHVVGTSNSMAVR